MGDEKAGCTCNGWVKAVELGDVEWAGTFWLVGHDILHKHEVGAPCPWCKAPLTPPPLEEE